MAQADLNDLERESEYVTLSFPHPDPSPDGRGAICRELLIATTRPELLPACVAVFVHPDDLRYQDLDRANGCACRSSARQCPILADPAADPEKGTGAVMCCTFGDATDVAWQRKHNLPLIQAIDAQRAYDRSCRRVRRPADRSKPAGRSKQALAAQDLLAGRQPTLQTSASTSAAIRRWNTSSRRSGSSACWTSKQALLEAGRAGALASGAYAGALPAPGWKT